MIFLAQFKVHSAFKRREFLAAALLSGALSGASVALHAESLPQLAALELRWAPSLVWIYFQHEKKKTSSSRRENTKERHQGFYVSSTGWILASVPKGRTGDVLIVEHRDGQRRRGKITHHGLENLVLIEEDLLPQDIPAAVPFAETYRPHRNHWLYGVALHAKKGYPFVAAGGLAYQKPSKSKGLSTEKQKRALLYLEIPLWPGTPVFYQNKLIAVCCKKISSKKMAAVDVKSLRSWLKERP